MVLYEGTINNLEGDAYYDFIKANEATGFVAGMSPEDAERYIKYCDECEKGIHNNHPVLDEQQYLDDFSYKEHFAGGDIEGITTKDPLGINNQEISYASFEGEYEPIKFKSKENYPESPMFGED